MNTFNKRKISHTSESGYTILESLVAMIVVAVMMSAVAPIIVFSVGTRVQARRTELAAQAARSYIDGVRAGTIPDPTIAVVDPSATTDLTGPGALDCPNPPDATSYCTTEINASSVSSALYCVDGGDGGDCTGLTDMVVYAIGFHGGSTDAAEGYELFVRVYRGSGIADAGQLSDQVSSTVNNAGLASRSTANGEIIEKPLFSTKTEISPTENSFQNYRDRIPSPSPSPSPSP